MSDRLEALEKAEAQAARTVEEAQREAQRIRASIADEKAALRKEMLKKLHSSRKRLEAEVRDKVAAIEKELEQRARDSAESLRGKAATLERRALTLLLERISAESAGPAGKPPREG
ncbi:hypothetical protein JW921_05210 [Candidatus Fermentibacterales bacterium]|nr:hypothetical protein [Candidatus Fermentibacterales bacterium]